MATVTPCTCLALFRSPSTPTPLNVPADQQWASTLSSYFQNHMHKQHMMIKMQTTCQCSYWYGLQPESAERSWLQSSLRWLSTFGAIYLWPADERLCTRGSQECIAVDSHTLLLWHIFSLLHAFRACTQKGSPIWPICTTKSNRPIYARWGTVSNLHACWRH